MKTCSKCGQQIHDEAVICVHCGCAAGAVPTTNAKSPDYNRLMTFADDAKSVLVLGILSLALCMGIGLIFQLINMAKFKRYKNPYGNGFVFPEQNLVTQEEIYICETAKKRFNTGRILTMIGYIITIVLLFFLFMTLFTGVF